MHISEAAGRPKAARTQTISRRANIFARNLISWT
jgi:hypothetical protein